MTGGGNENMANSKQDMDGRKCIGDWDTQQLEHNLDNKET